MKKNIQILLVDDHQVVRDGLRHMLGLEEDMEVVGEAADAEEALTQVESLFPEIILMDIKMPGMDGVELTRQVRDKQLPCSVIMLTLYDEYLTQAIEAGAAGYLLKDIKRTELTQAIRQVHRGEVVISESITAKSPVEGADEKAEEGLPQEHNGSGIMVEEVQLVIPPPVDANHLIRFAGRLEDMLQSRMLRTVGSWKGGTAITLLLPRSTPLANILSRLEGMSEVEAIGDKPLTEEGDPSLLQKAAAIPRLKTRLSRIIFVTLKNG